MSVVSNHPSDFAANVNRFGESALHQGRDPDVYSCDLKGWGGCHIHLRLGIERMQIAEKKLLLGKCVFGCNSVAG